MKKRLALFIFTIFTLTASATEKTSPTLKSVMQELGKSMDSLNRGIFYEDFKIIEQAAFKVANHPKPKSQLPTVIKTLNIRMTMFKSIDNKVHTSAIEIVKLAKKKDMIGILAKHRIIMNNCVSCHSKFRIEISKALSAKK